MAALFFVTEGVKENGDNYESAQCDKDWENQRAFYHEMLDEFLASFKRDPKNSSLKFEVCSTHSND